MKTVTDLDEQIRRVEHQLVAREARLHSGLVHAGQQLKAAARPYRWVAPAAGALAVLAVWKLLRHRRAHAAPVLVHSAVVRGGVLRHLMPALAAAAPLLMRVVDRNMRRKDAERRTPRF